MRCLYCGKPLPLLKKLTGGGEFCSDAHRHKYQEEYNKLALSRLLQAQSPSAEGAPARNPRQLPAPGARPGQRALPPPQTRQLAAPSGPPPVPPTPPALKPPTQSDAPPPSFQPFEPSSAPVAAAAATPPPPLPPAPPPMPDPPFAPFRLDPVPAVKPSPFRNSIAVQAATLNDEEASTVRIELESGLAADPFDWQSLEQQVEEASDPTPPEAAPWEHPISFAPPPAVPSLLMVEAEWHASPLFPALPEQDMPIRYPKPVRRKATMPEAARTPLAPGQPERVAARAWEVTLGLPAWKPKLSIVLAPSVGQPLPPQPESAVAGEELQPVPPMAVAPPAPQAEAIPEPIAAGPEAVEQLPDPVPAPPPALEQTVHQEVFVDLSILEKLGLV